VLIRVIREIRGKLLIPIFSVPLCLRGESAFIRVIREIRGKLLIPIFSVPLCLRGESVLSQFETFAALEKLKVWREVDTGKQKNELCQKMAIGLKD
jgi:hypothetical protein